MTSSDHSDTTELTVAPPAAFAESARVGSMAAYSELYDRSVSDPEAFWADVAKRITWDKPWDQVLSWDFHKAEVRWFDGARLNASV
ncbi:MAG: acetyl-CoA synthetase, partial [Pseudohongiellaceae bacterium]